MTFEDDHILLNFDHGTVRQPCKALDLEWPPPEVIAVFGFTFRRLRFSSISDEQRSQMTHICRGAEYTLDEKVDL